MASIKRRADGVWRARYRDETGKEHARHFTRKVDAQRWLDEVTTSVISGSYVDPRAGTITFTAYYQQWSARQVWAPSTARSMKIACRSVPFADVALRDIRSSHIEGWIKTLSAAGLAPSTIATRFNCVHSVLRAAHRDRLIGDDPAQGTVLPRRRRRQAAMRIPTPERVGAILAAVEPSFAPLIALMAFAGLRIGEASAVKVTDVDFLRKRLTVSRQVQPAGNGGIRLPKYGSERTVALPDELVWMLSEHIRTGVSLDGWLFIGPPSHPTVYRRWREALEAAGVSGYTPHDCRHFYASGLIAAGCDVVTVQRALGHHSASTTLDVYSHLWPSSEDRISKASGAMMRAALADQESAGCGGSLADLSRTRAD